METRLVAKLSNVLLWFQFLKEQPKTSLFTSEKLFDDSILAMSEEELANVPVDLDISDKEEYESFVTFIKDHYNISEEKLEPVIEFALGLYVDMYRLVNGHFKNLKTEIPQ